MAGDTIIIDHFPFVLTELDMHYQTYPLLTKYYQS